MYPKSFINLVESLRLLPGVGRKTAERMAFHLLNTDIDKCSFLSESIKEAKEKIHKCKVCNNYTEEETCNICSNSLRDSKRLCVVEDPKTIFLFEEIGKYNGLYYVIDGLISPLDGINPEDIGIEKLLKRIKDGSFEEIILAVKPSVEGETTALYIKHILSDLNIKITKIASGIPMGADIEYIDNMTLEKAMDERKEV